MKVIQLQGVSLSYGKDPILEDLTLEVDEGERLVIHGPSGCGKTTLLRLIAGFLAPQRGTVVLEGKVVSQKGRILVPPEKRNLGMVFQDLALWPHLPVEGNIEFGLRARGMPKKERKKRVEEMLKMVNLSSHKGKKPTRLSGGEQQRLALARALVLEPRILLMDEPFSSLDPELNRHLRGVILHLQERLGFTLIYVTHSREEARDIATRLVLMKKGKISEIPWEP